MRKAKNLWTTEELEDWWIHNKLLPAREVAAGMHFKISLSVLFRHSFLPSHAQRLIFYLTADPLVCIGVEGLWRGFWQWKWREKNDGGMKAGRKWQTAQAEVFYISAIVCVCVCSSSSRYGGVWLWWERSCKGNGLNFTNGCTMSGGRAIKSMYVYVCVCFKGACSV